MKTKNIIAATVLAVIATLGILTGINKTNNTRTMKGIYNAEYHEVLTTDGHAFKATSNLDEGANVLVFFDTKGTEKVEDDTVISINEMAYEVIAHANIMTKAGILIGLAAGFGTVGILILLGILFSIDYVVQGIIWEYKNNMKQMECIRKAMRNESSTTRGYAFTKCGKGYRITLKGEKIGFCYNDKQAYSLIRKNNRRLGWI